MICLNKVCLGVVKIKLKVKFSAFSKTRLPPELRRVLSWESPAVFLHFPLKEKGLWGPFYQRWQVPTKGRHLLQILLKALEIGIAKLRRLITCSHPPLYMVYFSLLV